MNIGEFELIDLLTKGETRASRTLSRGIGDDCAVISQDSKRDYVITTDALVESVHFRKNWASLKQVGRKSLSVNVSDVAAMGAAPRFYTVSIAIPKNVTAKDVNEFYKGMNDVANKFRMILIGGDTVRSPKGLFVSITVIGEIKKGLAIQRCGAKVGDAIYVSGTFGGSALGMHCLSAKRLSFPRKRESSFIKKHLEPNARVSLGQRLSKSRIVNSMIDVSDGLFADLSHIADASKVGFRIEADKIPFEKGFVSLAKKLKLDPVQLALSGGEDYELVFTVGKKNVAGFERRLTPLKKRELVTKIGYITRKSQGQKVVDGSGKLVNIKNAGFDHFK